jgi:hypothetical protein
VVDVLRSWVVGHPDPANTHRHDRSIRRAFAGILDRSIATLTDAVNNLAATQIVPTTHVEVRVHSLGPSFKLYLLNGDAAFFGFYPVTTAAHTRSARQSPMSLHHPSGWDATLFTAADGQGSTTEPAAMGPPFTIQAQRWFDSIWTTIARDFS